MSALMKKHPTEKIVKISWHGGLYALPIDIMERYKVTPEESDDYVSIEALFANLTLESGEPAVLLKGLRYREALSQLGFAKKLHISQTNLSAMENGRRTIGKEFAKRIADIFKLDYRIFL